MIRLARAMKVNTYSLYNMYNTIQKLELETDKEEVDFCLPK